MNKSINLDNKNTRKKHSKKYMKQLKKRLQISMFSIGMVLLLIAGGKLAGLSIPINNLKEDIAKTGISAEESKTSKDGTVVNNNIIEEVENVESGDGNNNNEEIGSGDTSEEDTKTEENIEDVIQGIKKAKVSSGNTFTIALKEDGSVWSWGAGTGGQLGTGNLDNQSEPVQVLSPDGENYLTNVIDIAVGYDNAMALLEDGTIVAWGDNGSYNLGDGTNEAKSTPVYVVTDELGTKLNNIVKITKGDDWTLALTAEGEVYSWGYNTYGELGINNTEVGIYPTKVKDATGENILTNVVDIESTGYTAYAILEDGKVMAWGYGANGELGNGTTTQNNLLPKETQLENIEKISASSHSAIALTKDGKVYGWGWNGVGQLANGTTASVSSPIEPKLDAETLVTDRIEVIDIGTAGGTHYILDKNQKIYAAGLNSQGQIGDNTTANKTYFVEVKGMYGETLPNNFVKLSSSVARLSNTDSSNAYFIREDGSLLGVGKNTSYGLMGKMTTQLNGAKEMNPSYMEITDRVSYIKIGETKKLTTNIVENFNILAEKPVTGKVTWSSSNTEIATVDENGNITAKGEGQTTITAEEDKNGYIASATIYVTRNTDKAITIPQVEQGFNFTIVLKADGSVWATGANAGGACGVGKTDATINTLTEVKLADGTPLTNIVKISAGYQHALALTADGKVYSWGLNTSGQLGINTNVNSIYAVEMLNTEGTEAVKDIIDIAAGGYHSAVLAKDGKVYSTGYNAHGELGNATNANSLILTKTEEVYNIVSLSGGMYYTTMLRGDGTVWTVGYNYYGHLGINTTQTGSAAASQGVTIARQAMNNTRDGALKNVIQISAGGYHTVALTRNKEVFTWGYGVDGQLGLNSTTNYAFPQKLLDPTDLTTSDGDGAKEVIGNIAKIGTTERGIFIITNDKKVYATGENTNYQLSQNNNTDVKVIKQLYSKDKTNHIEDVINVSSSCGNTNNTAIITSNGTVWVSGLGSSGQIGNGGTATATVYTEMGSLNWQIDESIQIATGEEKQLNVSVTSLDGAFNVYGLDRENRNLKYESLDEDIVEVSDTGLVKAKRAGRTTIRVTHIETGISRDIAVHGVQIVESIVQGVRDADLPNGNYTFRVINGAEKKDYEIELINYYDDVTYSSNVSLGDSTTEYKMLVVKYHKNLTINSGVTVTANRSGNYTYKKGMYLCVMGELKNYGTISMTARGTYNCAGENVYLWKNTDGTMDYVPAVGGAGAAAVSKNSSGRTGSTGSNRRTGGGGSGGIYAENYQQYSGAGSAGTSYSGGSGGGGFARYHGNSGRAGSGAANGGPGGNGFAEGGLGGIGGYSHVSGGGAGNVGGSAYNWNAGQARAYNGENGTGGLLILYANSLVNNGQVSSCGVRGGYASPSNKWASAGRRSVRWWIC